MSITRIAMMTWIATSAAQGAAKHQTLTVYLRARNDQYMITPLAQTLATRMFAHIGIALEWKSWKLAAESPVQPILIEVETDTPLNYMPGALGYAQPYQGSHISVFLDRILGMESPAIVMAHVFVHEITHIIQGASRHSETGVMKAHWSGHDLCEMWHRPLPFAPVDLDLIQRGLSDRRAAPGTTEVPR